MSKSFFSLFFHARTGRVNSRSNESSVRSPSSLNFLKVFPGKRVKGFTLPELLVVLVIIGILLLIALPNLMPLISKAKSSEAQMQLNHVHTLQKNYFYMYSRYTEDLEAIDYVQEKLVTDGGSANYRIEMVEVAPNTFKARATAVVDFDGDGVFNVWEIDQDKNLEEVTKD